MEKVRGKKRMMMVLHRSALTGKVVWMHHDMTYDARYKAYKRACMREINRMRQWTALVNRRRRNVTRLLSELTSHLPILGDIPKEQREAAKVITQLADKGLEKQSDFYEHIREEKRQRENARKREKRWQEKYGRQNGNNRDYVK